MKSPTPFPRSPADRGQHTKRRSEACERLPIGKELPKAPLSEVRGQFAPQDMRKKTSAQADSRTESSPKAPLAEKTAEATEKSPASAARPTEAPSPRPRRRRKPAEKAAEKTQDLPAPSQQSPAEPKGAHTPDEGTSAETFSMGADKKGDAEPSRPRRRHKKNNTDTNNNTDKSINFSHPAPQEEDKNSTGNKNNPTKSNNKNDTGINKKQKKRTLPPQETEKNNTGNVNNSEKSDKDPQREARNDKPRPQKEDKNNTGQKNNPQKAKGGDQQSKKERDKSDTDIKNKPQIDQIESDKNDTGIKKADKKEALSPRPSLPRKSRSPKGRNISNKNNTDIENKPQTGGNKSDTGIKNAEEKEALPSHPSSPRETRPSRGRKFGNKNNTGINNDTLNRSSDIDTGNENHIVAPSPPPAPSVSAVSQKPLPAPEGAGRRRRKKNPYVPTEYGSVQMMSSLHGFAPLGMLFVLMDVLKGREEGLIHINQLAQALSIGKPSLLAQLENLEAAGLLRTLSSSRMGRHIELLSPNMVRHVEEVLDEGSAVFPSVLSSTIVMGGADPEQEAGGQFSVKKLEGLARYLQRRGVEIVSIPDESDLDPRVSQLAAFLGKYLSYVLPFYDSLKATLNEGEEFSYSMAGLHSRDVTHTLNFCRMLQEVDFLASYTYRRAPHCKIVARVNRTPTAINFLTGGWLEHFIRDKVVSILTTHPATLDLPYAFMKNPRIILPGEEDFELDLLLSIGERIFWIEAKTGEYMDFLPKYSRVSKVLGLNRNTSMLVSVDTLAPADNLSARYELSCCNLDEFADVFRINLVRELQQGAIRRRRG